MAISSAPIASSLRIGSAIAQPTTRRRKTSRTTARYRKPLHVGTYVISATHNSLGPSAEKRPPDEIRRRLCITTADRRNHRLAARSTADAAIAHQSRHAFAADADAFINEFCVFSRTTVRPTRSTRDRFNPVAEQEVALRMLRWRSFHPCIKTACRSFQYAAHRVDRIRGLVRLHESKDRFGSILSRANQAVTFERISRSISSCVTRLQSRAISWRSSLVRPSLRSPASNCAWRTQLRIVWPVGSNSSANSSGDRPARTSATSFVHG